MLLLWSSGMSSLQADFSCSRSSLVMFSDRSLSRELYSAMVWREAERGETVIYTEQVDAKKKGQVVAAWQPKDTHSSERKYFPLSRLENCLDILANDNCILSEWDGKT